VVCGPRPVAVRRQLALSSAAEDVAKALTTRTAMETMAEHRTHVLPYRDRSRWLGAIGALLLLIGGGCALLGPVELYSFYLFSEGGRFHYPGFGFGSFMFAVIAIQILGYYVIAAVCVPLGVGHLRLRRWARRIALAGLGFWLAAGIPLVLVFLAMFAVFKDPSLTTMLLALPLLLLLYPVLPILLALFYRSHDVARTFDAADPQPHWTEALPLRLLVLCQLYAFFMLVIHSMVLFQGAFPLFGLLVTGLPGFVLIAVAMACLALLIWGTLQRQLWAWWGGLACFALAIISLPWTFARLSWTEILASQAFAPLEIEALSGIPISGWHIAVFFAPPLLATLGLLLASRRHFGSRTQDYPTRQRSEQQ